jgi:hypothetical protein
MNLHGKLTHCQNLVSSGGRRPAISAPGSAAKVGIHQPKFGSTGIAHTPSSHSGT